MDKRKSRKTEAIRRRYYQKNKEREKAYQRERYYKVKDDPEYKAKKEEQ